MRFSRPAWRDFVLMTVPCLLVGLGGTWLSNRPQPKLPKTVMVVPVAPPLAAPTPATFVVEVKPFRLESVTAENKKIGADTCVTIGTKAWNAPANTRWFYARRLIAVKNGKSRVIWHDTMSVSKTNPVIGWGGTGGGGTTDAEWNYVLFQIKSIPKSQGELVFLWDAFVQPVSRKVIDYESIYLTIYQLNRIAKRSKGLRLSRRLVVRP